MSSTEDAFIDEEVREFWWEQGEAVMREIEKSNTKRIM